MSFFKINSETLDRIANAINAKTGKTAALTPAQMVTEIGSISGGGGGITPTGTIQIAQNGTYNVTNYASAEVNVSGGGGGISWELIADYTSDANAEIVKALIPDGKQNANVYKVQVNSSGTALYYPYIYANDIGGGYFTDGTRAVNCVFYVVKKPADNNSEVGGSSDPSAFTVVSPRGVLYVSSPFVNVGLKAYSGRTIPSGINIKVWRLVE